LPDSRPPAGRVHPGVSPDQAGVAEPGAPETYLPPSRTRGLALGFIAVVAIGALLVLWVLGGVGIGPLTSLHPSHTSTVSPALYIVRGVSLLVAYPHGSAGVIGPENQSTCVRCPLQFPNANPCNFTLSIVTQVAITNQDSFSHTIDGVTVDPNSSNSPNETWTAGLWNASGGPMIGPYTLPPGQSLPYSTLNSTLTGSCSVLSGSVWVAETLNWSP
jgi:hypothetical protein